MRIAVIGAGGVGGYFGGKLAYAGHDVTFIARGKHLQALRDGGIQVKSIMGDFDLPKVKATNQLTKAGEADLIILAVKAWQVADVAGGLKDALHEDTIVLPLQNGVLAAKELGAILGEAHVLGGLCRIISKIDRPGVIHHFGATPNITLGELDKRQSPRSGNLASALQEAGIHTTHSRDIHVDLWKKFIFICVGGLEAITRTTNGEMRSHPETRALMRELLQENCRVAQGIGVDIEPSYVDATVGFIDALPEDATFSMARDLWDNRPSELDYLNGAMVKLANECALSAPINQWIYHCLLPRERKARGLPTPQA